MKKALARLIIEKHNLQNAIGNLSEFARQHGQFVNAFDSMANLHRLDNGQLLFDAIDLQITRIYSVLENHGLELPLFNDHFSTSHATPLEMYMRHVNTFNQQVTMLVNKLTATKRTKRNISSYQTEYAYCGFDCN